MIYRDPKDWGPALKTRLTQPDMSGKTDAERVAILKAETANLPQRVPAARVREAMFVGLTLIKMQAKLGETIPAELKLALSGFLAAVSDRDGIIDMTDPEIKATVDAALATINNLAPDLIPANVMARLNALMVKQEKVWPPELDRANLTYARSL